MPLPPAQRDAAERILARFCKSRVPGHVRHEVRLATKTRGNHVTLVEQRPHFLLDEWVDIAIAQFRYDEATGDWTLYCVDRNERWHEYHDARPSADIASLLAEVQEDPTGIFWG